MRAYAVALLALLAAGCSGTSPIPIHVGDLCFNCRRPISDTAMAAEVVTASSQALKFRSVACMARYLKANPDTAKAIYVTDFTTGRFVKATSATFVPYVIVERYTKTPDYIAYYKLENAQKAAEEHKSAPIKWQQVMERAGAE